MEYRKLGESSVEVTPLAFGAWAIGGWMWGGANKEDAISAIHSSVDLGITTIDTAPVYGFGLSENIVGEAIKGKRDKVQILTKYGMRWSGSKGKFHFASKDNQGKPIDIYIYAGKESVINECEESLRRLKTDYIDLYQIHWPDTTTPIEETMEAVAQLMEQGKIRAAGVSNCSVDQVKAADKIVSISSNQVPYSMVNRGIEKEIIPYCIETNKSILAYSPLQRGLLTGKFKPNHSFKEYDHRPGTSFFTPENIKKTNEFLAKIKTVADEKDITLSQLVIRWTMQQTGITVTLVGARDTKQVEENAKAIDIKLTNDELDFISSHLEKLNLSI
jgi:aryl-alcohol dehydrogenase-like predicted oxidoreductase